MKRKFINYLILSSALLLIFSCKSLAQNSDIISINYTVTVGRGGISTISVTKDSISRKSLGGSYANTPNFVRKINNKEWTDLFKNVNINDLKTTESGKAKGHYDGKDVIFTITTTEKEYKIINVPKTDSGFKNIENLKNNIKNLVSKNQ